MTNDKVIKMYEKFLVDVVGCNADEFDNRPCDYGRPCNTCLTKTYKGIWSKTLHKALEEEADRRASKKY